MNIVNQFVEMELLQVMNNVKFHKKIVIVLVNINVKKNVRNVVLVYVNNANLVMCCKCLNVYLNVETIKFRNKNNVMMVI